MDDGDRNVNQLLADLYMKEQLIRVKGAATSMASLKASDMEALIKESMFCLRGFNQISRGFA